MRSPRRFYVFASETAFKLFSNCFKSIKINRLTIRKVSVVPKKTKQEVCPKETTSSKFQIRNFAPFLHSFYIFASETAFKLFSSAFKKRKIDRLTIRKVSVVPKKTKQEVCSKGTTSSKFQIRNFALLLFHIRKETFQGDKILKGKLFTFSLLLFRNEPGDIKITMNNVTEVIIFSSI